MAQSFTQPSPSRPGVAFIANSQTPYRLAQHRRVVRELPQIRVWSLYTHETSNANWKFDNDPETNPVLFGKGENALDAAKPGNFFKELKRGGAIIQWLKDHDIKVVVVFGYNDIGRLRIIRWCRRVGIPCFMWGDSNIHGDQATGMKRLVKNILVGRIVHMLSGVFICGSLGRAYYLRYGAKPEKMFFFPCEPDYELIQSLPGELIESVRERFNLQPHRRRLVYSGRLVEAKRVDLLIEAFNQIAPQRPDWDLVVIGDGPLKPHLQAKVAAGLSDRITWAGFIDDQPVVSAIYRNCDALVLPSDFEPWALVVNEAAASGLAIVCSNVVGAAPELVRDGVNGRLFTAGDLQSLQRAILEVTAAGTIDRLKSASAEVLADWRRAGDPIQGLLKALTQARILPESTYRTAAESDDNLRKVKAQNSASVTM